MASLTNCIKKAGSLLRAEDKAAILDRARELRSAGQKPADAGRQAIQEHLSSVRDLLGSSERQDVAPKPAPVEQQPDQTPASGGAATETPADAAQADRVSAIRAQYPDLMVQADGMDAPMRMDDFLAAAKAEADELAADAPLIQAAAECALLNGFS